MSSEHVNGDVEVVENPEPTFPCKVCSRKFVRASLEKHEAVCDKLSSSATNVFDSVKMRTKNSAIPEDQVEKIKQELQNGGVHLRPKTAWRKNHEELIDKIHEQKKRRSSCGDTAEIPEPQIFAKERCK